MSNDRIDDQPRTQTSSPPNYQYDADNSGEAIDPIFDALASSLFPEFVREFRGDFDFPVMEYQGDALVDLKVKLKTKLTGPNFDTDGDEITVGADFNNGVGLKLTANSNGICGGVVTLDRLKVPLPWWAPNELEKTCDGNLRVAWSASVQIKSDGGHQFDVIGSKVSVSSDFTLAVEQTFPGWAIEASVKPATHSDVTNRLLRDAMDAFYRGNMNTGIDPLRMPQGAW